MSTEYRLPVYLQTEVAECGLACLAMIATHHGFRTDLSTLRARFNLSLAGISFQTLTEYADRLKLSSRGVALDLDELRDLKMPCVLHWDMMHFVVLRSADAKGVVIHDPAAGVRHLTYAEVSKHFTGMALELDRMTDFRPADERRKVSVVAMIGKLDGWWQSLGWVALMALALEALGLATPKAYQYMVDEVAQSHDSELRDLVVLGLLGLAVTQTALAQMRGWTLTYISTHLNMQWVSDIFSRLLRMPMNWFEKRQLGDVLSRFGSVGPIQDLLTTRAIGAALDGLMSVVTFSLMMLYSPALATISLLTVALYALVRALSYRPFREASLEAMAMAAREQSCLLETVRSIQPIKLFGRETARRERWLALHVDTINRNVRTQLMALRFTSAHDVIALVASSLILWIGIGMVMEGAGAFTIGMLFALTAYSGQFNARTTSLINVFIEYKMLSLHCERLADIALEPTEPEVADPRGMAELVPRIELVNVWFRYSDNTPWIVRGVSLVIEPGEFVAFVGPSGCGKSTLIKLILGSLQPAVGEIRYGGVPVQQLGVRAYRSALAAVMQDDALLAGSVTENISFFDARPDRERVERCATAAAVHSTIKQMVMGYDTLVSDIGSSLSGGQKQRVMLARALYKDAPILLLDEATSHLDVDSERAVNANIEQLAVTRIIAAHRPETIASAQRLIALDKDGKVAHDLTRATAPEPPVSS